MSDIHVSGGLKWPEIARSSGWTRWNLSFFYSHIADQLLRVSSCRAAHLRGPDQAEQLFQPVCVYLVLCHNQMSLEAVLPLYPSTMALPLDSDQSAVPHLFNIMVHVICLPSLGFANQICAITFHCYHTPSAAVHEFLHMHVCIPLHHSCSVINCPAHNHPAQLPTVLHITTLGIHHMQLLALSCLV